MAAPATTQPTSTTAAPSPTTAPTTTTTTIPKPTSMGVAPYFLIDEAGHEGRVGPFLAPVYRSVPYSIGTARASLEALLAGPSGDESRSVPAISSSVPEGSRLNGIVINNGTATVDLNAAFGAGDDSAASAVGVAQVVFTLTRFSSVDSVLFLEDGRPVSVQTSGGQLVDRPVSRDDYREFQAMVSVDGPVYGGPGSDPLRVTGEGAVFEVTFQYVLTDGDGLILEEGFAMTADGTRWASFDFTIDYDVDRAQLGHLIVWVNSAKDGSQIDIREYPIRLTP